MRVLTAIVLWIISEMAVAGPLEEANSAYDKGDFGLARNFYNDLAIQGDRMSAYSGGPEVIGAWSGMIHDRHSQRPRSSARSFECRKCKRVYSERVKDPMD